LVLFSDLSELAMLREKAERAERLAALGRLAAGLAHEIRNPLGSISGSVELVRDTSDLGDEDQRLLTLVLTEVDRLDDLVTTMLDVGRPREPVFTSVDVGALATDVAKVVRPKTSVTVTVEVPPDPVRVHGDPGQLRQVLWNLIKNAMQFSPAGGEVTVVVDWDEDSRPCVTVRDEGPGIEEKDLEHLFDAFYSKRRHGVGLGLALVRQIVEAHHGAIDVTSEPGEGASFRVHLPPAEPASVPMHWVPQPMAPFPMTYSMQSTVGPGECGPFSSMFRNAASDWLRESQSVRIRTHEPGSMSPCCASQALTPSAVSRKSGFAFASAEQSMTFAGATTF